jgi:hypothetical protein
MRGGRRNSEDLNEVVDDGDTSLDRLFIQTSRIDHVSHSQNGEDTFPPVRDQSYQFG